MHERHQVLHVDRRGHARVALHHLVEQVEVVARFQIIVIQAVLCSCIALLPVVAPVHVEIQTALAHCELARVQGQGIQVSGVKRRQGQGKVERETVFLGMDVVSKQVARIVSHRLIFGR